MATLTIAELPVHERPVLELLRFDPQRTTVDVEYAGYGWAKLDRLWLSTGRPDEDPLRAIDDVLVLALHSSDDAEALPDDIELEFELPDRPPVSVLASVFLARWLPKLPRASQIALALCNPHRATLRAPASVPLHYALGDVESWLQEDPEPRIILAAETWCTLQP